MGLDVTSYSNMKKREFSLTATGPTTYSVAGIDDAVMDMMYDEGGVIAGCDPAFEQSFAGLEAGGIYDPTDQTETHDLHAGPYSAYGSFRRILSGAALGLDPAKTVWVQPDEYVGRPFFELIHFSDCEGTIGPLAAQNLLEDFRENRDRFEKYVCKFDRDGQEHYVFMYGEFERACELAAQDGLIRFH